MTVVADLGADGRSDQEMPIRADDLDFVIPTHRLRDVGEAVAAKTPMTRSRMPMRARQAARSRCSKFDPLVPPPARPAPSWRPIDLNRMPELFGGFERQPGEGPVFCPVACAPQAWAASSGFLLLQAALG